jgi:SAM-dependent methyltransferase
MTWQTAYLERFYSPADGHRSGTAEFHEMCARAIRHGGDILEIGCGPTNHTSQFLAALGRLHGLDPDPAVKTNASLTSAHLLEGEVFPFPDATFDGCVSNYAIEHIPDPGAHLREVARVLKPGGAYVLRTPNRWHYVALVASMTPHWVHELLANRLRGLTEGAHDPYPTTYAMNTRGDLERHAAAAGLAVEELRLVEKEPSYGMSSRALFLAFTAYERAVNATDHAAFLRSNIFAVLRKPG